LQMLLKLLHPFMPFVTEELSARLPGHRGYLMRSSWPEDLSSYADQKAEEEFEQLIGAVNEIRSYRRTLSGAPAKGGSVKLEVDRGRDWEGLLSHLGKVTVVSELPHGKALGLVDGNIVFPELAAADPSMTAKKVADLQKELETVERKLANPQFRLKAPGAEIAKQEARAAELRTAIDRLE
jgi:valyl-tRNA synthetase